MSALFYSYDKPWYFSISAGIQALILVAGTALMLPEYGIIAAGWVRLTAQVTIIIFTLGLALYSHRNKYNALPRMWVINYSKSAVCSLSLPENIQSFS